MCGSFLAGMVGWGRAGVSRWWVVWVGVVRLVRGEEGGDGGLLIIESSRRGVVGEGRMREEGCV